MRAAVARDAAGRYFGVASGQGAGMRKTNETARTGPHKHPEPDRSIGAGAGRFMSRRLW